MEVEDNASMISRTLPSGSETSDHKDSLKTPPDPPFFASLPALEESLPPPVLSLWQDVVSAIKIPPRLRDDSGLPRRRTHLLSSPLPYAS